MFFRLLCGLGVFAFTSGAVANNRPTLTISSERYLKPDVYLLSGTVGDERGGARLVYKVRGVETVVALGQSKNWKLRLRLRYQNTRLVFWVVDAQGARSGRQKRLIARQSEVLE